MTRKVRGRLAYYMFIGAVAAGVVGFIVGKNATDNYKSQPPGMWVLYGLAGILILGAIFVMAAAPQEASGANPRPTKPALVPGWYDDPEDPNRLRYWDGGQWTDKTAAKSPPN